MSAFLDALSGAGYDGSESGGIGDVGGDVSAAGATNAGGGGFWSGLVQASTALGTGYLSRRMDIDLYQRQLSAMPYPGLGTTQGQILINGAGVPRPGGAVMQPPQAPTLLNISALLPFLLVGGVVYLMTRKG